jgi:SecD/SecF fusion protein
MHHLRWRVAAVITVLVGAVVLIATRPARLGLDLRGGTQIALQASDTERQHIDGDTMNRTLEVLRRRVDQLGVAEPTLQRSGDRRIIVELPGLKDPDQAVAIIGRTAQLAFHPVLGVEAGSEAATTSTTAPVGEDDVLVLPDEDGIRLRLGPPALTGDAVRTAKAVFQGAWEVEVDFRGDGQEAWEALTGKAACAPAGDPTRRIAIALDQKVISSPQVAPQVACDQGITGGTTVITGSFGQKEAKDLALLIRAGALPVPVEVIEQRTVGPTLGKAAIDASVKAALIGAALTALYMIAYYRILGALAALALAAYGAVSFAMLLALGATLTLPGMAGFVLAIGMAVDANVLVFERIKEEHVAGASVRLAARNGFRRAWTAIADSNATTVLAAMLLFFYASGAVRGFGITLTIGVIASMFTALVLTRVLVDVALRSTSVGTRPRLLGLEVGRRLRRWLETRQPNLVGKSRRWLAVSGVAVILALVGLATRGLDYGLEFSGGRLVEYDTARPPDLDRVRSGLAGAGFPRAVVQESGDGHVAIRTQKLSPGEEQAVEGAVEDAAGPTEVVREEFVGPTIGDELRRKAAIALALALLAQLAYLALRFHWTYGSAAVVAMFHDVAILLGVFAWLGKAADGVFLAGLLTVIGYSVNDSVVVFDRIRELRHDRPRDPLVAVVNDACLQTVPRTINTGLGAVFILVALYFLGGETLTDFALALLIGILVGTYSSVFTAAPLLVAFERREPLAAGSPAPPQRRAAPEKATAAEAVIAKGAEPVEAAAGARSARPAGRPTGKRKPKRR